MNDDIRIKKIRPEEEAAAAAAASGAMPASYTLSDYRDWQGIKDELHTMGIESTGNYQQDIQIKQIAEAELERAIEIQKTQQSRATENVTKLTDSDDDQAVKGEVANGTSSIITAELMRLYHLLKF